MVVLERLEVHIVDHCNLRCRACNHASPAFPKGSADPAALARDLSALGALVHAGRARVTGGEPLLHPEIDRTLSVIRDSGIAGRIEVITNGTRLMRMTPEFWDLVDGVDLSIYPGVDAHWPPERAHKVFMNPVSEFYETFSTGENPDPASVRRIWESCGIKDVCYALMKGHFFTCMRAAHIPSAAGLPDPMADGIPVDGLTEAALLAHMRKGVPLAACRYCTGTSGRRFPHSEAPWSSDWMAAQRRPLKEMLPPTIPR